MRICTIVFCFFCLAANSQKIAEQVTLPNGWKLSPAGVSRTLGDLPLNISMSKTGKYFAVVNCGQSTHSIQLFDAAKLSMLDSIVIPKAWYGLEFSSDDKLLYASGGNDNMIRIYSVKNKKITATDSIVLGAKWPYKISLSGLTVDDQHKTLYVVSKENNKLYCVDLSSKMVKDSLNVGGEAYTCILSANKQLLYVSCWGCDKVKVFDTQLRKFIKDIVVGDNPNEMIFSKNGKYLFVCNANDNSVSVIDVDKQQVIETLNAALYPDALTGSTTNSLTLNAMGNLLFVANADNNNIAVFDVSTPGKSVGKGFIPVGWYPTSVRCYRNKLLVANGKGFSSMANPNGPNPLGKKEVVGRHEWGADVPKKVQYIGALFGGTLSIIDIPDEPALKKYTTAVYKNTPYSKLKEANPDVPAVSHVIKNAGGISPVKYVFYVIKENRTYDQVLGDVATGNGDTSLVLFGEKITPNQHKLVNDFVLLDNFYVDAEVSADGHNWSMGAYANDYIEKTWPTSYGSRGGTYASEGKKAIGNNKAGFIWDICKKKGVSYRTYGEFADNYKPNIPSLKNNMCKYFAPFNFKIKDTTRFIQWKTDFDSLLAINAVPAFNTVRFGNDHTEGLKLGRPTPFAHVADNDLAVGLFIEHLSKSSIWNETAVFILEDDAQNGADHVDAHRSTAYVAGGFVKRGFVDHTPYSTTSMLRTIELILGLPPMSQYDAAATPMWRCFDSVSRPYSFAPVIPQVDMDAKNMAMSQWQRASENFNLAKEDSNPDVQFNQVLWHAVKGEKPFPGPTRAVFIVPCNKDDD